MSDLYMQRIQKQINYIKNYKRTAKEPLESWVIDSYIDEIQNIINDYNNREFKKLEPDTYYLKR